MAVGDSGAITAFLEDPSLFSVEGMFDFGRSTLTYLEC